MVVCVTFSCLFLYFTIGCWLSSLTCVLGHRFKTSGFSADDMPWVDSLSSTEKAELIERTRRGHESVRDGFLDSLYGFFADCEDQLIMKLIMIF